MSRTVIYIDGKPHLWSELLKLRREQRKAARQPDQETLFPLKEDSRPASQRSASGRYEQPLLFKE
jgi:hypothetical protein